MTAAEKADLLARLDKAEAELRRMSNLEPEHDRFCRLRGKAEGVALAASYVREIEATE